MLVPALLSAEKVQDSIVGTCEARAGLFQCHEWSRKQFSTPWSCCEACAGLVKCQERSRKQFSPL